jgi:hypothetical protein
MTRNMLPHLIRSVPAVMWMILIFFLSSRSTFPKPPGMMAELAAIAMHLFLYGTLGALILLAIYPRARDTGSGRAPSGIDLLSISHETPISLRHVGAAVFLSVLYGVTDEIHQSFIPGRNASVLDIVVNTVGATASCTTLYVLTRIRPRSRARVRA